MSRVVGRGAAWNRGPMELDERRRERERHVGVGGRRAVRGVSRRGACPRRPRNPPLQVDWAPLLPEQALHLWRVER